METYKRKLEDLGDLRRQVRLLEERNTVYMQRTCELEEELRRANAVRSQLDTYKRQASCGLEGEREGVTCSCVDVQVMLNTVWLMHVFGKACSFY